MQKSLIIAGIMAVVFGGVFGIAAELLLAVNSVVVGSITGAVSCCIFYGFMAKYIKKDGGK
jgi:hypothetical protein